MKRVSILCLLILAFLALAVPVSAQTMITPSVIGRLANLPAGSVISWDGGDVVLTPSSNMLTLTGGDITVPNLYVGAAGKIDFGSGDVTVTVSTNTLTLSGASTGYVFSTGPVSSLVPLETIAGTGSITSCMGHTILVTAAGTATLPAGTTLGQRCTVVSTTAAIVSTDVASASDTMILNGTPLTAGFKATSDGTDEATLYCENNATNVWRCRTIHGLHSDGGA